MLIARYGHIAWRTKDMSDWIEDFGRLDRQASSHAAGDKDLTVAEQSCCVAGAVFVHHVTFRGPGLGRWIKGFVLVEEPAFQSRPTNDQNVTIRSIYPSMVRTMKVHRCRDSKSLRDRVIDFALIVRTGPRKSATYEYGSVRQQIHLMIRACRGHDGDK